MSVCLIFFLALTSVKIGQWPGNFVIFLNYIGLFYIWKIVIVSYIDLFTGHFKNFNAFIFSVHFYWLKLSRNFDTFLNYTDLIYISEFFFVSSMHGFTEQFKKLNIFTVIFNGSTWHEISVCFLITRTWFTYQNYSSYSAYVFFFTEHFKIFSALKFKFSF